MDNLVSFALLNLSAIFSIANPKPTRRVYAA